MRFKTYLFAGAIPALLFPFAGLATSYIGAAKYDDYAQCVAVATAMNNGYQDRLNSALRNYSCWFYAYTLCKCFLAITPCSVYLAILYKPSGMFYKLSGLLMTCLLLAGYGVTIANLIYASRSQCSYTAIAKVCKADAIIFLVIGSILLVFALFMALGSWCAEKICKKPSNAV
jgi:hypothetical protein